MNARRKEGNERHECRNREPLKWHDENYVLDMYSTQYVFNMYSTPSKYIICNFLPSCTSLFISTQLVHGWPKLVLRCECSTTSMYTNRKGAFVHVWGTMGLLRALLKLLWNYHLHTWYLLRAHVKFSRARVKSFQIFSPYPFRGCVQKWLSNKFRFHSSVTAYTGPCYTNPFLRHIADHW